MYTFTANIDEYYMHECVVLAESRYDGRDWKDFPTKLPYTERSGAIMDYKRDTVAHKQINK